AATGPSEAARPPVDLRDGVFCSMPKLARRAMIPEKLERRWLRRLVLPRHRRPGASDRAARRKALRSRRRGLPWIHAARRRRVLLMALVLIPSGIASGFMVNV